MCHLICLKLAHPSNVAGKCAMSISGIGTTTTYGHLCISNLLCSHGVPCGAISLRTQYNCCQCVIWSTAVPSCSRYAGVSECGSDRVLLLELTRYYLRNVGLKCAPYLLRNGRSHPVAECYVRFNHRPALPPFFLCFFVQEWNCCWVRRWRASFPYNYPIPSGQPLWFDSSLH